MAGRHLKLDAEIYMRGRLHLSDVEGYLGWAAHLTDKDVAEDDD